MTLELDQMPMSDNLFVARTKAGELVLAQRIEEEGRVRVQRLAVLDQESAVRAKKMLDRLIGLRHRQNFTKLAQDPSKIAMTSRGHDAIVAFNKADEPTKIRLATKRPGLIRFLAKPSQEVELAAVRANPNVIRYIKKPSEKLQLEAVSRDGLAIHYIDPANRTNKVRMAAVMQNALALEFIGNPSPEVVKTAVERNPEAARFIKAPVLKRAGFEIER